MNAQSKRTVVEQPSIEPDNKVHETVSSAAEKPQFAVDAKHRILLLGNYRPTLTIARILSAKGHEVFSGDEGWEGGAQYSKAVQSMWQHPKLAEDAETFFKALSNYVEQNDISLIYPVSENFVCAFMDHPDWVGKLPPIAMHKPEQIKACLEKFEMYDRAGRLNVPTAPYARVSSPDQLSATLRNIGMPLVIRPESPTARFDNKKVYTIENEQDLAWFLKYWDVEETALLCQRHATGFRHNVYFAAERGQLFKYLEAKILKTDMPDGSGLATEGVTVVPNVELKDYTECLISDLKYTGIGCAQFLVDDETGEVSFLEINSRIAGNHNVPEAAGLELTEIPMYLAFGQPLNFARKEGKVGMRYVWTTGALVGAKAAYLRGDLSLVQSLKWMVRAAHLGMIADIHMVFSWRDPKPALKALAGLLPSLDRVINRIKAKLSTGSQ